MTHDDGTRTRADGTIIDAEWVKIQMQYARWWFAVMDAGREYVGEELHKDSEDLGDWAESIHTLMTFGPNPRGFDPPISEDQVAEYFAREVTDNAGDQ